MLNLRIAHVVHRFNLGGLERGIARLVNRLNPSLYEHRIYCLGGVGEASVWVRPDRAKLVAVPWREGRILSGVRSLARQWVADGIDIVHSHNWGTLVETAWSSRRAGIEVHVHGLHGAPVEDPSVSRLRSIARARVTRRILDRVRAIVAVSDSVRQQFVQWCGIAPEKVEIIYNGVDRTSPEAVHRDRERIRRRLKIGPETSIVGSVGRLEPVKGFDLALQALAEAVSSGWDLQMILVGQGSVEADLRRQAEQLGVTDRLHLIGGESEVEPWLAAMDIFMSSSRSEGLSQSILEAMAVGLPLVVTEVGESAQVVREEPRCGLAVPPEDSQALADALRQLRAPERRRSWAQRARMQHQRRFQTETMVQRYDRFYRRAWSGE